MKQVGIDSVDDIRAFCKLYGFKFHETKTKFGIKASVTIGNDNKIIQSVPGLNGYSNFKFEWDRIPNYHSLVLRFVERLSCSKALFYRIPQKTVKTPYGHKVIKEEIYIDLVDFSSIGELKVKLAVLGLERPR